MDTSKRHNGQALAMHIDKYFKIEKVRYPYLALGQPHKDPTWQLVNHTTHFVGVCDAKNFIRKINWLAYVESF